MISSLIVSNDICALSNNPPGASKSFLFCATYKSKYFFNFPTIFTFDFKDKVGLVISTSLIGVPSISTEGTFVKLDKLFKLSLNS